MWTEGGGGGAGVQQEEVEEDGGAVFLLYRVVFLWESREGREPLITDTPLTAPPTSGKRESKSYCYAGDRHTHTHTHARTHARMHAHTHTHHQPTLDIWQIKGLCKAMEQ